MTLRPNGDVKVVGATTTGGTVSAVLGDNNLGTYAKGTVPSGFAWLNLGTSSLGALRVRTAQIRIQNGQDVAEAAYQTAWARFRDPAANPAKVTGHTPLQRQSTTVSQQRGPVVTSAPGGLAWTQAVLDRMQIEVAWQTSPGENYLRLHELYVDLETNNQPTVVAPTVTENTVTTRPLVSVDYAQFEGYPQTRGQVKIFSAAQYGAAGFNVATSTATWDSGELYGTVDFARVTSDLTNGTTYRAYTRAAMDWPGPESANLGLWWSAWSAPTTFTVAVSPPPAPTVTVTPDPTLPGYRMRLSASLDGLNLLDSDTAGFEGGIGFWQAGTNTGIATSATNPKSGTQALQLTATAAGAVEAFSGGAATSRRVKPGATYTALASYRGTTARTVQTGIRWYDATGAVISTPMGTGVSDTTTGYTQVSSGALVAPSNAFSAVVRVTGAALAAAEVLRVDEVQLAKGTSSTWSAGGYAQNGTVLFERSQRISPTIGRGPARNWLHPQIRSSGGLTTTTDGYYQRNAVDSVNVRALDRAAPEAPADTTAAAIEWRIRTGSGSYLDIGMQDSVATDGMHPYMFPAVPNVDFTFSIWLWASAAINVRVGLYFTDAFNSALSLPFSGVTAVTTSSTGATKITVSGTAPAGTVYARAVIENNSGASNLSLFSCQPRFRPTAGPDEAWPGQVFAFTWETVRGSFTIGQDGEDVTGADHEYPPGRPVIYRATIVGASTTGQSIAGAPSTPVHVLMDPPSQPLLKDPFQPENAVVLFRYPDSISRAEDASVHHPYGRDGDPVKVTVWQGGNDNELTLETVSAQEFYRLMQLLPSTRPLLMQHHDGGQTYFLANPASIAEQGATGQLLQVRLSYYECRRPA